MYQMIRQNPKRQAAQLSKMIQKIFEVEVVKSGIVIFKGFSVHATRELADRFIFNMFGGMGAAITVREYKK